MAEVSNTVPSEPASLQLFTVRQVAGILQVHEASVRRLIVEGRLSACRVGVFIRVPRGSLESFLEKSPYTTPDSRRAPRRRQG